MAREVTIIENTIEDITLQLKQKEERIHELEDRIRRIESFIGLTPSVIEQIEKRGDYR